MYPQQVHGYLIQFFNENNCKILNNRDHYMDVQLTIEMDKRIMNRPYYWKYVESVGGVPNPAQLTFITDKNRLVKDVKGEVVHFGSPRLSQLFHVTKELGSFVQMFEKVTEIHDERIILTPWLGVNYKISYHCDRTKEILYSLGLNLMTGIIVHDFQEIVSQVELDKEMSGNTFNLPYIIKPIRGLERLDATIDTIIKQDDHTWAAEAKLRLQKDLEILEHFYEIDENKPESYDLEKEAMGAQYEAKVKIEIVNGGLFYLK